MNQFDFNKFLANLKLEARSFALFDRYCEADVLDSIIRCLENSLDNSSVSVDIAPENDPPF